MLVVKKDKRGKGCCFNMIRKRQVRSKVAFRLLLVVFMVILALVYFIFATTDLENTNVAKEVGDNIISTPFSPPKESGSSKVVEQEKESKTVHAESLSTEGVNADKGHDQEIKNVEPVNELIHRLFRQASSDPDGLIRSLELEDPFGTALGPEGFTCPYSKSSLVTYPDLINHRLEEEFRKGEKGSWVMYQHLRKAGGTGFCDLAKRNMPHETIPPYYCMPDQKGSLATPPWNDATYISREMTSKGYRIAANEWDNFIEDMLSWPGAVLATTFRHPIDRWFSQYRFEMLERRDGSKKPPEQGDMSSDELAVSCSSCSGEKANFCFKKLKLKCMKSYYDGMRSWTMGSNYYVNTFRGQKDKVWHGNKGDFYWTYHKFQKKPLSWEHFSIALANLRKFHLILILEWMDDSAGIIDETLGWNVPPKQVLPHENQAKRKIGDNGSKKSLKAKELLSEEDYRYLIKDNIYDVLFFHIAKRIFLERQHKCLEMVE